MAILKTDIKTAQDSVNAGDRANGGDVTANVTFAYPLYTTTGAEAAADTLDIIDLPVGAIVLPSLCRVDTEASGGTGTAISKIGDSVDDDRYTATSIALTSAASTAVTPVAGGVGLTPYKVTEATKTLIGTVALSSGSVTAGKKVRFTIAYRLP